MPRAYKVYIQDILEAIKKIENYTHDLDYNDFKKSDLTVDGVVRNLEIIGEAAKNIPTEIKIKYKNIEWKKIMGLRDILIHEYFGVDLVILWDIIQNKLPSLKKAVSLIK
jgi:uncharacterized protein with HEPN domain